jgi:hypothetical protein
MLGADPDDLAHAVYKDGPDAIETFVDKHFETITAVEEERLGDALVERLGVSPSSMSARRVYAKADGDLSDAWLARSGLMD